MSSKFEPGDWALHKNNQLDSREVVRVGTGEDGKRYITLDIFGHETDPVPASNYTRIPKAPPCQDVSVAGKRRKS